MSEAVRAFAEATESMDDLVVLIARHLGLAVNATCLVRLLSEDGRFLNPTALWCTDPSLEPTLRRTIAAAPVRVRAGTPAYDALRGLESVSRTKVALGDLGVELRPEHEHLRTAINPGPLLLVSLRNRERAFGLAYLIRRPGEGPFEIEEEHLVQDLVDQAAVALGNSARIRKLQTENATIRTASPGPTSDQRVERLDALAALAAGLAHDYDNLISVVRMCTNLRLEALDSEDPMHAQLAEVRQACEQAAELTPLLSVLAQRQQLQPELVDIVDVLRQLRPGLEQLLSGYGTLHSDLREGGRPVCVDRPQLAEAVTHLILNARSALIGGGHVRLLAETRTVAEDDLLGVPPGDYAVVSVDDDGVGMDPEIASRATRPFYSQWPTERSSGLGLAIVVAFARQSGGTLTVASRPQQGTTVSLFLPVVGETTSEAESAASPSLDGIETILLAVADFAYRAELRGVLRRAGYQVLDVQTPRQAVDVARTFDEVIHLIIIDVGAPELTAALAKVRPQSAWLAAGQGVDPARQLMRGQQDNEILARVRWALTEGMRG